MSVTAEPTSILYVQLPDVTPQRVLHACQVVEVDGSTQKIHAAEALVGIKADATLLVYFEQQATFVQQPARVRAVEATDDGTGEIVELELLGKPVNAEQRQVYRVSCLESDINATMNNEPDCKIVDISATGFGVHCASRFHIGASVAAQVHWQGETLRGPVVVVSVRQVSDTQHRYGVRSIDSGGTTLHKALTRISLGVQREQMRRIR